jgi:hypothetical protein
MYKQGINIFIKAISLSCLLAHALLGYTTYIIQLFLMTPPPASTLIPEDSFQFLYPIISI